MSIEFSWKFYIRYHSSNPIERKINNTNQSIIPRKLYDTKSLKRLLYNNRQNSLTASKNSSSLLYLSIHCFWDSSLTKFFHCYSLSQKRSSIRVTPNSWSSVAFIRHWTETNSLNHQLNSLIESFEITSWNYLLLWVYQHSFSSLNKDFSISIKRIGSWTPILSNH